MLRYVGYVLYNEISFKENVLVSCIFDWVKSFVSYITNYIFDIKYPFDNLVVEEVVKLATPTTLKKTENKSPLRTKSTTDTIKCPLQNNILQVAYVNQSTRTIAK